MTKTIPLIRAANVVPMVRWIEANRLSSEDYLYEADLDYWFALAPTDPIPLRSGIALLRALARDHGPGIGNRIVTQASVAELGFIGSVALGARSPLEALQRLGIAMPLHSSHELFDVKAEPDEVRITHSFSCRVDDESVHIVQVLLLSMLQQLLKFTTLQPPLFRRARMLPHPDCGLSHVSIGFSDGLYPSARRKLVVGIDPTIARLPFPTVARDRTANLHARRIPPLAKDCSLAASVQPVIAAMLHGGEPTIERIARAYGGSVRSLQRRLRDENTSYSEQLDLVRRNLALAYLSSESVSLSELSERLGYSAQSALSRAVRRLTGRTPSELASED